MSEQYAVIDSAGKIRNIVLWDGKSGWQPLEGLSVVACTDGGCLIGGHVIDGKFLPPEPEQMPPEQLIERAQQRRATMLNEAQLTISIWQTKLLMGRKLTDDESKKLNSWMDYIDVITAIDPESAPDIEWPETPA